MTEAGKIRYVTLMTNFRLTIEYDGGAYHGWQKQKHEPTIQAAIETALKTMTGQKVNLTGSGRTDAGVHALGQVANFHCTTDLAPDNFKNGLNSLLADDIAIVSCERVPSEFHARYDARDKTYRYWIRNRPEPPAIFRQYAWHVRQPLDIDTMRQALPHITGRHDFKSFEAAGTPKKSTVRTVLDAAICKKDETNLYFELTADGFLRYMVRNIVGTLVDIGLGRQESAAMETIRETKDRSQAAATAPPQGLFLVSVAY